MKRLLFIILIPCFGYGAISQLHEKIADAAHHSMLDPLLVEAVVSVESNFQQRAKSNKGAMGLMQVMPTTAAECGIQNPFHATDNLMGACECLRKLINRYQGNLKLALAAYNAGTTPVDRHGGVPPYPETVDYVRKILKRYRDLKTKSSSSERQNSPQDPH